MGDVYGNVNVNYSYCKSGAQLKSAADYILGRRKEQVEDGVVKTEPHLYKAFGSNRDNFANSLLITRKMHDKGTAGISRRRYWHRSFRYPFTRRIMTD